MGEGGSVMGMLWIMFGGGLIVGLFLGVVAIFYAIQWMMGQDADDHRRI